MNNNKENVTHTTQPTPNAHTPPDPHTHAPRIGAAPAP
jgi:hypothetical protein